MGPEMKKFDIEGAIADPGDLIKKQAFEEDRLKARMLKRGYVPVLDITPIVTTEFLEDKGTFRYVITMYGVHSDEPWKVEGWLSGRWIQATTNTKSRRLSKALV